MGDIPEWAGLVETVRSLAVEESPLWGVLQEVDSRMPDRPEVERLGIAARTVGDLLARGVVELVWTRWTAGGIERRVADAGENKAILHDPQYWKQTSRYERYVELHYIAAGTHPRAVTT